MIDYNFFKVVGVNDQQFEQFANKFKYVVLGAKNDKETIVGFSNETALTLAFATEFKCIRFAKYEDVKDIPRNSDLYVLNITDAEYVKLESQFKYTILGWDDTEEDEGEDIIGFTDLTEFSHKVIWDYDYFCLVDIKGQRYMPSIK